MTLFYTNGFETGDASELAILGSGASIVTTPIATGAYALNTTTNACRLMSNGTWTSFVLRFYINAPAFPATVAASIALENTGSNRLQLSLQTSGVFRVSDIGSTLGLSNTDGTRSIPLNRWTLVELIFDAAASGIVQVWIDGVLEVSTTHTNDVSATVGTRISIGGATAPDTFYFDDVRLDVATTTRIGAGRIIARQGLAGTPNADAWTKNGAATAALCWSDTPFATATNCTSSTSAAAQTMLVAPFTATQAGHGNEVIGAGDTINCAKTVVVAKRATSGNPSIRRRIAAANTDTAVAMTASDACWDDGLWTVTLANLATAEIGMVKAADTNLTTCEDAWLMVDYTDVLMGASIM